MVKTCRFIDASCCVPQMKSLAGVFANTNPFVVTFSPCAATVRVGDGNYIIHVREPGQDLVLYSLRGILHGRSNALHGGRDAQNVFRSHASVRTGKTSKRVSR